MKRLLATVMAIAASQVHAQSPMPDQIIGGCRFDRGTLAFAGTAVEQAQCLLRPVMRGGGKGVLVALPKTLAMLIGTPVSVDKARYAAFVVRNGLQTLALDAPVSRANDNDPAAAPARYFVIHDTSTPWLGDKPFPRGMNRLAYINDITSYATGPNAVAHVFNSRQGVLTIGHDFATPWRATKLEKQVGLPSKGLFLHIENLQPRRRDGGGPQGGDTIAPKPGFTRIQYRRLAQLYAVASIRAGAWLIPGFHAGVDDGIRDAHDDPQNFRLKQFDRAVRSVVRQIEQR